MSNPLNNYNILIADADQQLAAVLKSTLREMGFSDVETTRSGNEAKEILRVKSVDFLITEWNIQHLNGIELITHIRRGPTSRNPLLPIIMLTGRAEETDVAAARDSGINEYVIKPFSAKTIYNRLERIIEKPRNFIAAPTFVGPDRRHKGEPPPGVANRRTLKIPPKPHPPKETSGNLIGTLPKVWTPDYSLKQKLGTGQSLQTLITPEVLSEAQSVINAITTDSLQWVKGNLAEIKSLHQKLVAGDTSDALVNEISEVALAINSRSGTFGYERAAEIAYKLYLFCRNKLQPNNPTHHIVIQKHIEVLQVILSNDMHGMGGKKGELIAMELHNLVLKYTT